METSRKGSANQLLLCKPDVAHGADCRGRVGRYSRLGRLTIVRRGLVFAVAMVFAVRSHVLAAELSANDVTMEPGTTAAVVVSGTIAGEAAYAVEISLLISRRPTTAGTVQFTPAPPVDIVQVGNPWPRPGFFEGFDTDRSLTPLYNGSVANGGTFFPEPVTYSGPLASFPVIASEDADGVWDVVLYSSGSTWVPVPTTVSYGTITVVGTPGPLLAVLDIKPQSCPNRLNVRSHGVIPMVLVGSETFDVADVEVDSLWLSRAEGAHDTVIPITRRSGRVGSIKDATAPSDDAEPCICYDRVRDGIDDLLVKFSVSDMVRAFSLNTEPRGVSVPLVLSGHLLDSTPFEASDCVVLTGGGKTSSERGLGGRKKR